MAFTAAATPQAFNFGGRLLSGVLLGFTTDLKRRSAKHEYLKADGARFEDMKAAPRTLSARLTFIGADCAVQFASFSDFIRANPKGLLVHPIAGQWFAFCEGVSGEVEYDAATNRILAQCSWVESNFDQAAPTPDTPSVATATQNVVASLAAHNNATAKFMAAVAVAQSKIGQAMASVQAAAAKIGQVDDAMSTITQAVSQVVGASEAAIGAVTQIQTQAQILQQNVATFVNAASDIFAGTAPATAASSQADLLFGAGVTSAQSHEDLLISLSPTPAGAADAVGATEDLLATCYVTQAALEQARPPMVAFTVPVLIDVVALCSRLFPGGDAIALANVVMAANRIPNPAAIPAGTVLQVPSITIPAVS
jgi:prophage DNA circulation protein